MKVESIVADLKAALQAPVGFTPERLDIFSDVDHISGSDAAVDLHLCDEEFCLSFG